MSEVKHTPLPWRVVEYEDGLQWLICGKSEGNLSDVIGEVYDADVPEQAANARLIVQAVNSHGDLVEALRVARQALVIRGNPPVNVLTTIDTALSKVLELGEGL